MLKHFLMLFMMLFFLGCSSHEQQKIRIATSSWIGYTPLFYAQEIGELKKLNMKLIPNVSLAEASEIFEIGKAELTTTTQHEYFSLKESVGDIVPIILIDRSNGADIIFSNTTLKKLYNAKIIHAYLESDSINNELLKAFLEKNKLTNQNIVFTNIDQLQISDLANNKDKAMLIVSYSPYNSKLREKGFKELASTKDIDNLVVIDALCVKTSIYKTQKKRLQQLKVVIDDAIEETEKNPEKVYKVVAKYLEHISFKEFVHSLNSIIWINKNRSKEVNEKIEDLGYKEASLIK